jgi:hypothetical protein
LGFYVGEIDSGVKHLSNSTIELRDNNLFELTNSLTSLESTIPSTQITEIEGKFNIENDHLILFPVSKKVNWLTYAKNPDTLNFNPYGSRKSAMVVVDTSFGQIQTIKEPKPIKFNLTSKQNSKYIWNDESCFVKYLNSESSNDLTNYCSELTINSQQKMQSNELNGKIFYWEDSENTFVLCPKKSVIEFINDTVYIIDFPLDPAGTLMFHYGLFYLDENNGIINCEILKSVSFSMNIGQTKGYSKGCKTELKLQLTKNKELLRSHMKDTRKINENGEWEQSGSKVLKYIKHNPDDYALNYKWTMTLKGYENIDKLHKCK